MASIIIPSRWARQPSYPVQIDRSNHFGSKIISAMLPLGTHLIDAAEYAKLSVAEGSVSVRYSGTTSMRSLYGLYDRPEHIGRTEGQHTYFNGSSSIAFDRTPYKGETTPVSVSFFRQGVSSPTYEGIFSTTPAGSSKGSLIMWSSSVGYLLTVGEHSSTNRPKRIYLPRTFNDYPSRVMITMLGGPCSSNESDYVGYLNGERNVSNYTPGWGGTGSLPNRIGYDSLNSRANSLLGDFFFFDGALSAEESFGFLAEPYQIYVPRKNIKIIDLAAGGDLEPRYGRPVSDSSAGAWLPSVGSDLFAMLDEDTPGDDSDYIYTSVASVTVQKCTSLDLAGMTTPRISIKVPTGFTASGTLTVQLWQGDPATGSLVAEIEEVDPAAGTYTHTLTSGEKAEITDGTDLYWRIEAIAN